MGGGLAGGLLSLGMRALIFDFDGLIADTETPSFEAWQAVYEGLGVALPRDEWVAGIGTIEGGFDPAERLSEVTGRSVEELRTGSREVRDALHRNLKPLPGVRDWLAEAGRLGARIGIASSSPRSWVAGHLESFGLLRCFSVLVTGEDVTRGKPDPSVR